jgi:hypothetical protein
MQRYAGEKGILVATDCIIFGFDGWNLKLLLVQRGIEPEKNKWSLMGGFIKSGFWNKGLALKMFIWISSRFLAAPAATRLNVYYP